MEKGFLNKANKKDAKEKLEKKQEKPEEQEVKEEKVKEEAEPKQGSAGIRHYHVLDDPLDHPSDEEPEEMHEDFPEMIKQWLQGGGENGCAIHTPEGALVMRDPPSENFKLGETVRFLRGLQQPPGGSSSQSSE
jgi:hypothetical protein